MRRTGTVVRDTDGALKLRVVRPAECEHCGMCPGRELLLDLPAGDWHVGDEVAIETHINGIISIGMLATAIGRMIGWGRHEFVLQSWQRDAFHHAIERHAEWTERKLENAET